MESHSDRSRRLHDIFANWGRAVSDKDNGLDNITVQHFNSAVHIEGSQNFPPGHYRVTCITKPLTLFKERTMHTYPGLFTVARLKPTDEAEGYVIVSTNGSLPPEFFVKDDGSVEKRGFWPPEDDQPIGVKFSD